jgi:hypothetical protein
VLFPYIFFRRKYHRAHQIHKEILTQKNIGYPQSEWLSSITQTTTNACEDVREKEPLYTVGGNVN